jgi:putative membrane protein
VAGAVSRAYVPSSRRAREVGAAGVVPWLLAAATIGCQIAYPLLEQGQRSGLTVTTVVLFCLTSVTHAALHRGAGWAAAYVVVAVGVGLAAEAIGVATGWPFGEYDYAADLGPQVLGVPVVIPLAWAMFAYPALLVGRQLGSGWRAWVVAAAALASWDLFLDPQMVAEGHWRFDDPTPAIPGIPGVPIQNYVGWVVVALVLMGLLHLLLPDRRASDAVPATLFLWTYASSVLANAVFFDRPRVALVGGVVMGLVAVPFAVSLWRDRP